MEHQLSVRMATDRSPRVRPETRGIDRHRDASPPPLRRLVVDLQTLTDTSTSLDARDPLTATWREVRRRILVVPGPRDRHQAVAAGIVRNAIEDHALDLRRDHAVREIVDAAVASDLDRVSATTGSEDDVQEPVTMVTSIRSVTRILTPTAGRGMVAASVGGGVLALLGGVLVRPEASVSAAGVLVAAMPLAWRRRERGPRRPMFDRAGRDRERIEVGPGWIRTDSGRRRCRDEVVTTVLRSRVDSPWIEVRLVGLDRVVRLRFNSVDDPAFRAFWIRWAA